MVEPMKHDVVEINKLEIGDKFGFKLDPFKQTFYFGGVDGMYAKVYGKQSELKKDKNAGWVDAVAKVVKK